MSEQHMKVLVDNREKAIVKTSIVGVVVNVFLAIFKAIIGISSNSIAVTLDAVNNISDALSSVITIIGTKLGAMKSNKRHPLGYGRIEYLSSMVVAAIVLYAGITSLVESLKKIITPEKADYSTISLAIIVVAIFIKLILGQYVKKQGKKYNSVALVASGSEAVFDAILSASVLFSAIVYLIWNISLEAYVGFVISIIIIKAGIEMMIDTLNDILGKRNSKEEADRIKNIICEEMDVRAAYDLIMFNYGPNKNYASVHIELPDTMIVEDVDTLTRRIQKNVYEKTGVILTGVGVYSYNTSNSKAAFIRNDVQKIVMSHDWALQMHGFYLSTENKTMQFDVVVSFDIEPTEAISILTKEVQKVYPDYALQIVTDIDI